MEPFVGNALSRAELLAMARESYARFGHPAITPLVQIDSDLWVLELFHGPTLAFKDVAMQLLARLMDRVLGARGERATIVGATSGDTGGAAIEAFRGSKRIDAMTFSITPSGATMPPMPYWIDADARPEPPGGFPKGGVTRVDLPNRHLEYAITWYGLALTLIGVYLAFAASRLRPFSGRR